MSQDHNAEAVKIGIGLSTQFISAALGLLTLIGGIITYLLSGKEFTISPVIALIAGVIFLLLSIYFGFIGIAKARNNGNQGWWIIKVSQRDFDLQSLFGILGLLSFAISIWFLLSLPPKKDNILNAIENNQKAINSTLLLINSRDSCDSLRLEIEQLKKEISDLRVNLSEKNENTCKPSGKSK